MSDGIDEAEARWRRARADDQRRRTRNLLGVEEAMTQPQKDRLLDVCFRLNPHLRGAHVADVLDILMDTDASLSLTEPWWELHGEQVPEGENHLYSTAVYALIWSDPIPVWAQIAPPTWVDVDDLAQRAALTRPS